MKKNIIILSLASAMAFAGCTDLGENAFSEIPVDDFFKNERELLAYAGRAYARLQEFPDEMSLLWLGSQLSDETAVPAYGSDWYNNGRYLELQENNISSSNKLNQIAYEFVFQNIANINEILHVIEGSSIDFADKNKIVAEVKVLRALNYYWAMDYYGNIPFSLDYTEREPLQKGRKDVFPVIEQELLDNVSLLEDPAQSNHGRANKALAYSILAKMYLNAEEWIGEAMWDKAEQMCDNIIALGYYRIEDNFRDNFVVNNENSRENIFSIVYDAVETVDKFYIYAYTLAVESKATFNLKMDPWNGFICQPDFFTKYDADNDLRLAATFIYGQQKDLNGNDIYSDGEPFIYEPWVDESKYYIYNGGRGKWDGARLGKWEYSTDGLGAYGAGLNMANDFALFRYADIILMKAEVMVRQGRTGEAVAMDELRKIRTRAGLAPYTASELTLDELLEERGRELALEGHRRQDLIRFGKFGNAWWAKAANPNPKKLCPIPETALATNPNLVQNP